MAHNAHILVLDSIDQDVFVCGTCKSVYNSLQLFLDHKNTCSKNITAVGSSLQSGNLLNLVYETHSPERLQAVPVPDISSNDCHRENDTPGNHNNQVFQMSCQYCKKKFKKSKTLMAHIRTHNDNPYQCPICGRCFVQNSHLQRHILSHKVWPDGLSETTAKSTQVELLSYACSYCEVTLANYTQFRAHLKNHLSLKKFKCIQGECTSFLDSIESLLNHVSMTHKVQSYLCYICGNVFTSLEIIATHYRNHSLVEKNVNKIQMKPYKCLQCDATFRHPQKLLLHNLTENHKKNCIHCNKSFASDKRLRLHLQIHRKLKPFQCNICNSSFHMKKYLCSHMLKHGERQFTCTICKSTFKRQDLLQRHRKLHQIKKMLKCPFKDSLDCRKEFSRNDKLKSHIKYHTKHLTSSSLNKLHDTQGDTVEICIVPLDSKLDEQWTEEMKGIDT